jgi:hypothetical protein
MKKSELKHLKCDHACAFFKYHNQGLQNGQLTDRSRSFFADSLETGQLELKKIKQ